MYTDLSLFDQKFLVFFQSRTELYPAHGRQVGLKTQLLERLNDAEAQQATGHAGAVWVAGWLVTLELGLGCSDKVSSC